MTLTEDAVLEKLKNVIDPELFVNIVDLGLIYEINFGPAEEAAADGESGDGSSEAKAEESAAPASETAESSSDSAAEGDAEAKDGTLVRIEMTMTSPACPAGPQLIGGAKKEVSTIEGVGDVEVKIVLDPPWTPDRMTEDAKDQLGIF